MAKRRKPPRRVKAGRETPKRERNKSASRSKGRQETREAKQQRIKELLSDRTSYLRMNTATTLRANSEAEAKRIRANAFNGIGARYEIQTRKVGKRREWRLRLVELRPSDVRNSSSFKRITDDLETRGNSAKGRKAKALEQLGRREAFWSWAVGETNE